MNFGTGTWVDVNMTSLCGYVETSYDRIVEVFGEPTYLGSGDDKVDFEWNIKFDDGVVATIYNWKDYDGGYFAMSSESYNWHIGGNAGIVSAYINEYFENEMEVA